MRKRWFWYALSLHALGFCALAVPSWATVEEKRVEIVVGEDGHYIEEVWLRVRLETRESAADWAVFPIALDANRELETASGSIRGTDGVRRRIDPEQSDTLDWAGEDTTHSSARFRLLDFSRAELGSLLSIHYRVRVAPYFPTGVSRLSSHAPVEALSVDLRCAVAPCRWALHGPTAKVESAATEWGARIEGALPHESDEPTLLRFGWGDQSDWGAVASWYADLVSDLPSSPVARERAQMLTAGIAAPREQLARLLDDVRSSVRYVAVEVGVGGYRPSPPAEVAERRWGDCKDKAFLLLEQLEAVGITAHPALILSAHSTRVERDFPSPDQFNHLIVAVEADAIESVAGDPRTVDYLFVDPTLPQGGLRWFHPASQGQLALVVRPGGGELVETPVLPEQSLTRLEAELTIDGTGTARGTLTLRLIGARARHLIERGADEGREETARSELLRWLPAAELADLAWGSNPEDDVPSLVLSATTLLAGWLQTGASSLRLPGLAALPAVGSSSRVALTPRRMEAVWNLQLPQPCQQDLQEVDLANAVGIFSQRLEVNGRSLRLTRRSEVASRWLDSPGLLAAGQALAQTERRTLKRRIRFDCPS